MANYWKLYNEIKAFYFKVGKIGCLALNGEEIIFDQRGFRHLLRKGKNKRNIADQIRRFRLFYKIHAIIRYGQLKEAGNGFYSLIYADKDRDIKVVLAETKGGSKIFISIMALKARKAL